CISHGEIFHGTILENISLQRERATSDNIKMAIEVTGLDEYVSKMPLGLKTIVDPEGKKVPRNIQNRILLARAIVTKPILLILEDPLDHVSSEEKQKIISRLTEKDKPWSIIVSSVDTTWESFIKDKIMIENGELVYSTLKDDSNA
ncbi:MAG: hypothetical protein KJO50_06355, partial [Bacteroidia bacterium]|nr:hypothetical protein [Bacteroidia bacterium]